MFKMKKNYLLVYYVIFVVILAVGEIFMDFKWTNNIAMVVFFIAFYTVTVIVCMTVTKGTIFNTVLIYLVLASMVFLNSNFLLLISGIAVIFLNLKKLSSLNRLVLSMSTILLIAFSMLFGMTNDLLIDKMIVEESVSPNERYVIQQERINADMGGSGIKASLHKNVWDIMIVSYIVDVNNLEMEIEWIDDRTFTVDGEITTVKF